jgi:hypothetical protein
VIVPLHCKQVGVADEMPLGRRVYFLSRYLLVRTGDGYAVREVEPAAGSGLMREVAASRELAAPEEVAVYPERVNLHDRAGLIRRAVSAGRRCTVFTGHDEHMTFVLDPDESALLTVHVYDIVPPHPSLAGHLTELDATGIFGELEITFAHHIRDIRELNADLYPCRAAGFARTLDADRPRAGDRIAGCMTGRQILEEEYGGGFPVEEICPLQAADQEPFIARCCRSERAGVRDRDGRLGAVVHWGASPREIADAVTALVRAWRERR